MMRILMAVLVGPFWYARPENEWAELFWRFIPNWLAVQDKEILKGFAEGESSFYVTQIVRAWIAPILIWSGFIFLLTFGMLCINVLVRSAWTETEKLSYPIIQLPLQMTDGRSFPLESDDVDWVWVGCGASIFSMGFISCTQLSPVSVDDSTTFVLFHKQAVECDRLDTGCYLSLCGWTGVPNPTGSLIPLVGFSTCSGKAERILANVLGLHSIPEFPISNSRPPVRIWGYF